LVTGLREEERSGLIRHRRGGGRLWRNSFCQSERAKLSFGTMPAAGRRMRRAPFRRSTSGRRRRSTIFVIAGEEVGFDEIPFANLERAKLSLGNNARRWEEDAAGAVLMVNLWEEVKI